MNEAELRQLLESVGRGKVSSDEALARLRAWPYENLGYARIDHHRALREGFAEVVFCEGKTPAQAAEIFARIAAQEGRALATAPGRPTRRPSASGGRRRATIRRLERSSRASRGPPPVTTARLSSSPREAPPTSRWPRRRRLPSSSTAAGRSACTMSA